MPGLAVAIPPLLEHPALSPCPLLFFGGVFLGFFLQVCSRAVQAMIEVLAKLGRGPVFLAGEVLECVITFTNPLSASSTSASRYGTLCR